VAESGFNGLRVLIIEDESIVAMLLEDALADLGCSVVGIASRLDEAMGKVSSLAFDAAILDVNLNGFQTYLVAEALTQRGIPFVLSTGYGTAGLPEVFQDVPLLGKPFQQSDLQRTLAAALSGR